MATSESETIRRVHLPRINTCIQTPNNRFGLDYAPHSLAQVVTAPGAIIYRRCYTLYIISLHSRIYFHFHCDVATTLLCIYMCARLFLRRPFGRLRARARSLKAKQSTPRVLRYRKKAWEGIHNARCGKNFLSPRTAVGFQCASDKQRWRGVRALLGRTCVFVCFESAFWIFRKLTRSGRSSADTGQCHRAIGFCLRVAMSVWLLRAVTTIKYK